MERTREDVIADINEAQERFDRAVLEIGLLYYPYHKSDPEAYNKKVEEARAAELDLQRFEGELAHYPN